MTKLDELRSALWGRTYSELLAIIGDRCDKAELIDVVMNLDGKALNALHDELCRDEAEDVRGQTQRQRLLDQLERSLCRNIGRTKL